MKFFKVFLIGMLLCAFNISAQEIDYHKTFLELDSQKSTLIFNDDFSNDWNNNWYLDGKKGKIKLSNKKLELYAGERPYCDEDHVVLWTKQEFEGDLKIEYYFTRLDSLENNFVNIIYIQAQGSGEGVYDKDIFKWNQLREIPKMSLYFDHMDTYHVSYSVGEDKKNRREEYVRGRRYMPSLKKGLKGTDLIPDYTNTGLFKKGVKYHLTFIKVGREIFFNVVGDNKERTFYFNAENFPPINKGRIGLRQMHTKASIYEDFKVYSLNSFIMK